ncbi:hypothetical protein TCDM_12294 [Trypanosoma cruzi Dm28c]|uniref:Uncharacterized protein n=1 Tax=Trypanosoma cruzi Dm28c TaxID=1416333 RepID=V5AER8_TRYCR|nr:hypothetical protein TCDM_12294 [Trypanosoma cruzi Dm28c]
MCRVACVFSFIIYILFCCFCCFPGIMKIFFVPLFNVRLLHTVMCDVFSPFVCFYLSTRGAGLIAVRPTDCTKGGMEEHAGCRNEV